MKTEPATTKYKRYDATFKHSAVEHWMLSGKSARVIAGELGVTRSGYHAWASREPGVRARANAALLPLITQAHRESRQTYGSPRIRIWLQQRGQPCGRQRISKLMRVAGLNCRLRRRFRPVSLTDSNHDLPVAPNRLRDLTIPQRRNAVWVADIT
jgi:putative transposase